MPCFPIVIGYDECDLIHAFQIYYVEMVMYSRYLLPLYNIKYIKTK